MIQSIVLSNRSYLPLDCLLAYMKPRSDNDLYAYAEFSPIRDQTSSLARIVTGDTEQVSMTILTLAGATPAWDRCWVPISILHEARAYAQSRPRTDVLWTEIRFRGDDGFVGIHRIEFQGNILLHEMHFHINREAMLRRRSLTDIIDTSRYLLRQEQCDGSEFPFQASHNAFAQALVALADDNPSRTLIIQMTPLGITCSSPHNPYSYITVPSTDMVDILNQNTAEGTILLKRYADAHKALSIYLCHKSMAGVSEQYFYYLQQLRDHMPTSCFMPEHKRPVVVNIDRILLALGSDITHEVGVEILANRLLINNGRFFWSFAGH